MRSQFMDRRTLEHAIVVEISERGGTAPADVDAIEGVRASGPLHERRRRRRPGVLDVGEVVVIAHNDIQIACGRHKT